MHDILYWELQDVSVINLDLVNTDLTCDKRLCKLRLHYYYCYCYPM